jgi:hypothetical protein
MSGYLEQMANSSDSDAESPNHQKVRLAAFNSPNAAFSRPKTSPPAPFSKQQAPGNQPHVPLLSESAVNPPATPVNTLATPVIAFRPTTNYDDRHMVISFSLKT